jgi:AbrB family looped-hinge helix DNA binding protein
VTLVRLKQRGQITLPKSARERLNLKEGDLLRLSVEDGRVILEPATPRRPVPVWIAVKHLDRLAGAVSLDGNAVEDAEGHHHMDIPGGPAGPSTSTTRSSSGPGRKSASTRS